MPPLKHNARNQRRAQRVRWIELLAGAARLQFKLALAVEQNRLYEVGDRNRVISFKSLPLILDLVVEGLKPYRVFNNGKLF